MEAYPVAVIGTDAPTSRPRSGVVVFLGPSLDAATAETILPEATFLPPICQGQLLSAVECLQPGIVGIVDGEFGQSLSVWHKEILHVLGHGVRVFGASSMGALRAAECDVYGMEGVGRIYEWFRDEVLNADDEVALLHASAEDGWRNLTWPMVNVRATVERLRANRLIDDVASTAVLDVAKSLYFGSRTEHALASQLTASGRRDGAALAALVTAHYVDQKRLDAKELLARLAGDLDPAPGEQRPPRQRLGWLGETLRTCDTEVQRPTGAILRYRIVQDAALHEKDFEELQERALNRMVVSRYAEELGCRPTDDEVAAERAIFLRRRHLDEDEDRLSEWLAANDLDDERFAELLLDEARVRRMQRWYLSTLGYERNCGPVTDQLRLERRYPDVADRAARRAALAEASHVGLSADDEVGKRLVAEQMAAAGWRPSTPLPDWFVDHGFAGGAELLLALGDAAAARREGARRRDRSEQALAAIIGDEP